MADALFIAIIAHKGAAAFAVVDIIKEIFEQPYDRWLKVLLILSGFGVMALIAIWT